MQAKHTERRQKLSYNIVYTAEDGPTCRHLHQSIWFVAEHQTEGRLHEELHLRDVSHCSLSFSSSVSLD